MEVSGIGTYLYARNLESKETIIVELTFREAIKILRKKRRCGYDLGILGGPSLNTISIVYAEYKPFRKVSTISELFEIMER